MHSVASSLTSPVPLTSRELSDSPIVRLGSDRLDPMPRLEANPAEQGMDLSNVPLPMIRRTISEIESGDLDQRLVVSHLLGIDPKSKEFRQRYIQLRIESLMQSAGNHDGRSNSRPHTRVSPSSFNNLRQPYYGLDNPNADILPFPSPRIDSPSDPWRIMSLRDLFSFFGPMITTIIGLQAITSFYLGRMVAARKEWELPVDGKQLAALFFITFLCINAIAYFRLRGKDFHRFSPTVLFLLCMTSALFVICFALKASQII